MTHSIIIAVILIITGLLVWKYPGLIAGYNTMTPEQQRNVDIKGLKAFMCRLPNNSGMLISRDSRLSCAVRSVSWESLLYLPHTFSGSLSME